MAELWLRRTLSGFVPEHDADTQRRMKRIPLDTTVQVEIRQSRSVPEMRYYQALCALVAQNHEDYQTGYQVDQSLRILAGHVDTFTLDGRKVEVPRRIAFSKLDPEPWREYLSRAKDVVLQHMLKGVKSSAIEEEIARMVG